MTDSSEISVVLTSFRVEHVRIESRKSFAEVRASLERLPKYDDEIRNMLRNGEIAEVKQGLQRIWGEAGLAIFGVATHGDWLAILGEKRNALQYAIGNVLVSTEMTKHQLAAGLYAPLRIMLYENEAGIATLEYDRPSDLFGQFDDERVTRVAHHLDQQIYNALISAATESSSERILQ